MKKLSLTLLFLLGMLLPAKAIDQIELLVTVTNTPVTGDTLTINAHTRTWTNAHSSSTILTNLADFPTNTATTNLFFNLSAYFLTPERPVVLYSSSNALRMIFRAGDAVSASESGNWASFTYTTNTITTTYTVRVPITVEANTNQTNIASLLVSALQYSSNSIAAGWVAGSNYAALTFSNVFTGENSFTKGGWNNANLTNVLTLSGIMGNLTNGYWTNAILGSPKMTNAINYGNPFRSPGSGSESEQFGTIAVAAGQRSTALGYNARAADDFATSLGANSGADLPFSVAVGSSTEANSGGTIAIGHSAQANISNSIAIGFSSSANGTNSVAIGANVSGDVENNQIMLGSSSYKVKIPGRLEVTGQATNMIYTGTNRFGISGGPYALLAFRRYNNASLANGNNAGVDPNGSTYMKVSGPSAAFTLNGLDGGEDGYLLFVENITTHSMTVAHDSGVDPVAANRIYTHNSGDIVFPGNAVAMFLYDSAVSRWVLVNYPIQTVYADLYTTENAGAITVPTAGVYHTITNFNTAGPSKVATADASAGTIGTAASGTYRVSVEMSQSGTANAVVDFAVYTNGVATHITAERDLNAGGDLGSISLHGLVTASTNTTWDVRGTSDGNGDTISVKHGNFMIDKVE